MSFDRLAPHYTWMEHVLAGPRLQRCRVAWLDALADASDILIAGVGHGHFLKRCAQHYPRARITSVDASAGMLRRAEANARRLVGPAPALTFVQADLLAWSPPADAFDAIVTPFFLDCFSSEELRGVVARLAAAARADARWLVADFAVPARGAARYRARAVHALMYAFFRRVTRLHARRLTEPEPFLVAEGFVLAGRRWSEWGLLRSDLWRRGG